MNLDSDNDQPMRTPPNDSPPSSPSSLSPPPSPRPQRTTALAMQVNDVMDTEDHEVTGKKKREEREMQLTTQAENEKLLDKDWRHAWLQRWKEDPFDDTQWTGRSVCNGNKASSEGKGKGKGKEKA